MCIAFRKVHPSTPLLHPDHPSNPCHKSLSILAKAISFRSYIFLMLPSFVINKPKVFSEQLSPEAITWWHPKKTDYWCQLINVVWSFPSPFPAWAPQAGCLLQYWKTICARVVSLLPGSETAVLLQTSLWLSGQWKLWLLLLSNIKQKKKRSNSKPKVHLLENVWCFSPTIKWNNDELKHHMWEPPVVLLVSNYPISGPHAFLFVILTTTNFIFIRTLPK